MRQRLEQLQRSQQLDRRKRLATTEERLTEYRRQLAQLDRTAGPFDRNAQELGASSPGRESLLYRIAVLEAMRRRLSASLHDRDP